MAEDFGFVPDPPKKKEKEDFGFVADREVAAVKDEYVKQGGRPEDVYSPERARILTEQGPDKLAAEPPLKREDGSIAGPTLPTEEALAKGLIEKRAEPAVKKALEEGVDTVSSGYDQEKGVGFAVGRDRDGKVVRVEKEPDNFGFVPDEPKKKADDFGFIPDQPTSSTPDFVPDEKLTPAQSSVARESLGRFAKGALVTGPAALARTYGLVESAAGIPIKGEPYPFESTAGARIAQGIEQAGERLYPTIPEAQGSFIPEVAGGLGQVSTLPILGPAARAIGVPARMVPRAAAAGTGVVLGAGEGAQRASQAGAKPEEVLTSGFLSGATGLSEIFPTEKWIEKIDKATAGKFSRDVRRYFIDIGIEGGTEALQEGFQQVMGNLIAKGQYKPEQDVFEGAGKAALVGGTVGTIASGVIGGFGLSQARQAEAKTPVQAEATNEPQGLQPFSEFQRPEQTEVQPDMQAQEAQVQPTEEVRPEPLLVPKREDVVLSAGEKARLTRLDTIEKDLGRLKENDPDQAPYYDERLNQVVSERNNILRRAERPTKALAEEILQPDETGYDIIDFIQEEGGMLSMRKAMEQKNVGLYGKKGGPSLKRTTETAKPAEYDGMPKLDGPYLKLMSGTTSVDKMAQSAFENLGIGDGTSGGLWNAVTKAIESRRKTRDYNKSLRQTETQRQAFRSSLFRPKAGDISYQASNLSAGDIIRRGNVDFRVVGTDRETSGLVIDGGQRFGRRVVKPDAFIFADRAFRGGEPIRGVQVRNNRKSASPRQPEARQAQVGIRQTLKTGLDDFRRTFQDKFVDVENLQKRVGGDIEIRDFANIKQAEELYHGRVGERLTEFDDNFAKPITEDVAGLGLNERIPWVAEIKKKYFDGLVDANGKPRKFVPNKDIFDLYAMAKHAKERNAVIAQRFPNDPNKQDGGSGLTNDEADSLLVDGGIDYEWQARFEPIRQRLLEVNRRGILNLYEGGLINRETYDLLTERYQNYVPLMGADTGLSEDVTGERTKTIGTGAGFDVRGNDIILAEGRNTRATDILAYSFQKYMDSIIRSEKNRVMQTAEQFAISYPENRVIEVLPKGETGNPQAPDIIAFKDNGETKYLRINDPRLADVMKNRASPVLGSFIEKLASVNRYFAFINTQASPEFVISNFARDLQTALVNINSDQAQGLARDLLKNIRPALKATYRAELGKPDQGSRMDVFYRQFKAAGGRMTFFGLKDFQTLQRQIQSKLAGGGSNAATRVFRLALDRVGQLNGAVENATRLATFATLKERGFTDQQAAYAARNITVNFTRKGTAGPLLNAVYLFFNANIQGSARIVQALATSRKAQKLVLAVMVAGFFRDILNRIIGGEDETGMPLYDKIPEYQRRQNFIIMNPLAEEMGVQYFKFPMPYGYSVFDFAGQLVGDVMPREIYGGGKSPMQAATSLALAAIDNFNPIGGSYSLLQALSPTILTPVADLALNQDFSGRPIMPTLNPFDPVPPPDSQRYWNNVNPASKWVTEKINELTGGSRARAGAIDVSPETLDYGFEFIAGAVGKFGERVMMAPIRAAKVAAGQEDAVDLIGDIPMVRKVTGSVPSFVDVKRYQDVRKEILTIDKELKLAKQERDTEKVREILRDAKPELRLVNMVKATEQDLKELRTQKRKLQEMDKNRTNPAIQKRLDANRERQKALMIRTLERYNSSIDDKM